MMTDLCLPLSTEIQKAFCTTITLFCFQIEVLKALTHTSLKLLPVVKF